MKEPRALIQAFAMGDHLTDEEMVYLRDMYKAVRLATAIFGDRYGLVFSDAAIKEQSLDSSLRSRGVKATGKG
jgi:hypothetical protein